MKYLVNFDITQRNKNLNNLQKESKFLVGSPKIHRTDKMPTSGKFCSHLSTLIYITHTVSPKMQA